MQRVTSRESWRNFDRLQDEALLPPLSITRNGGVTRMLAERVLAAAS